MAQTQGPRNRAWQQSGKARPGAVLTRFLGLQAQREHQREKVMGDSIPPLPGPHRLAGLRRAGRYRLPLRISERVNKAELPFFFFIKQQRQKVKQVQDPQREEET